MLPQGIDDLVDDLAMALNAAANMDMRLCVGRPPFLGEARQSRLGVRRPQQRAGIPPRGSLAQDFHWSIKPDGDRALVEQFPSARINKGAAAGGDDADRTVDEPGDKAPFAVTEILFAKAFEDLGSAITGCVLDGGIAIDEGQAQPFSEALADSRFTRAHQSNQHDRPIEALRQLFHKAGLYMGLSGRAKGPPANHGKNMSRATLFLIVLVLVLVGGAVLLSKSAHEVPAKPIEVDVQS